MFNFRKTTSTNPDITRLQNAVDDVFKQFRNIPIFDGVLVKNVTIDNAAVTTFSHELDRQPEGYIIVDKNKVADIYRTAWTPTTLSLISTQPATTISIWIF